MIFVDSASLRGQEQAVLLSPVLDHRDWSCLRLVYQIVGRGSLQLHLRADGDNFDYRLWKAHKASDSWLIASVDLPNSTAPFQVGVAATRACPEPARVRPALGRSRKTSRHQMQQTPAPLGDPPGRHRDPSREPGSLIADEIASM